jgi:diguanylate cyclase (GGDEF)-like protein
MGRSDNVEQQLVATLYVQRQVLISGHAALFVVATASWFETRQTWFLMWAAAVLIVLVARVLYERRFHPARRLCDARTSRLIHRIGSWATGILLGCSAVVIVNHVDPLIQLLVVATETVFIMAGAARNAASKYSARGQILLGLAPMFVACLLTGKAPYMLLSLAILFELFAAFALVEAFHERLVRLLVLNEENSDLITQVRHSNDKLVEMNRRLASAAMTDSLTGIPNRRRLDAVLSAELRRAQRDNTYLAVLLLDVDYFKRFNDLYGHQAGDDCLQRVAAVIASSLNRSGDLVARYGGEEFVAVLPRVAPLQAQALAEAVRANIAALAISHTFGVEEIVTVSIGVVAALPHRASRPEDFLRAADRALYRAKDTGRNCIRWAPELLAIDELAKPQPALPRTRSDRRG